jgi:hypothetical protein
VKVPLHHQLLAWRGEIVRRGLLPWRKWLEMKAASIVLRQPVDLQPFRQAGAMDRTVAAPVDAVQSMERLGQAPRTAGVSQEEFSRVVSEPTWP